MSVSRVETQTQEIMKMMTEADLRVTPVQAAALFRGIAMPNLRAVDPIRIMDRRPRQYRGRWVTVVTEDALMAAIDFDTWFASLPGEARRGFTVQADNQPGPGLTPVEYWRGLVLRLWATWWGIPYARSISLTDCLQKAWENGASYVLASDITDDCP